MHITIPKIKFKKSKTYKIRVVREKPRWLEYIKY